MYEIIMSHSSILKTYNTSSWKINYIFLYIIITCSRIDPFKKILYSYFVLKYDLTNDMIFSPRTPYVP